jgi:hypothetical protein
VLDIRDSSNIPTWKAFNSRIEKPLPITRVATPPILSVPAHEWSTFLTILKQEEDIKSLVIGEVRKTVVTFDMGLYQPAQVLEMYRDDLKGFVMRPGELHTLMAMLRSIVTFIENSGLDKYWIKAGLYSGTTVKHILDGGHMKRALDAHIKTILSLTSLLLKSHGNDHLEDHQSLRDAIIKFNNLFNEIESIEDGHARFLGEVKMSCLMSAIQSYKSTDKPMFIYL